MINEILPEKKLKTENKLSVKIPHAMRKMTFYECSDQFKEHHFTVYIMY